MEHYKYFTNEQCEYYPCHEANKDGFFNCLFCFCPLYSMKEDCGGNHVYTESGIKDCSNCLIPHLENGYEYIINKLKERKDNEK